MKESGTDRGLIDLIRDTLDNYEEQYILGSWENFLRRKKRRKRFILWFAGTGIAASLLIGWLGFRYILSGTFNSNADRNNQAISNQEVPSEKETIGEDILLWQVPPIMAENNSTKSRSRNLARQKPKESRFKYQTQAGSLYTQNLLDGGVTDRSQSDTKLYLAEIEKVRLSSDTYKSVLLSQLNTADLRSTLIGTRRSDISGSKPFGGKSDIDIAPDKILSNNARTHKFRFGINFSPESRQQVHHHQSIIQAE